HVAGACLRALSRPETGRTGRSVAARITAEAEQGRVQRDAHERAAGEGHAQLRRQQDGHGEPRRPLRVPQGALRRRDPARPAGRVEVKARGCALLTGAALLLLLPWAALCQPAGAGADKVLRVCEDPNNLPFPNRAGEGFENKIAELLAAELGWKLEYTWFPQRMGFIRNTLRGRDPDTDRFKCDLVLGVPVGFELAATTRPYYRSTYALAYVKGRGLDDISAPEDLMKVEPAKLKSLRLGVVGQTPPVDWLLKRGLLDQVVPYQTQSGDPERYPGEMVEKDLVGGAIDVAFVWGPIAGYFGRKAAGAD